MLPCYWTWVCEGCGLEAHHHMKRCPEELKKIELHSKHTHTVTLTQWHTWALTVRCVLSPLACVDEYRFTYSPSPPSSTLSLYSNNNRDKRHNWDRQVSNIYLHTHTHCLSSTWFVSRHTVNLCKIPLNTQKELTFTEEIRKDGC